MWDDGFGKIGVRLEMNTSEGAVAIDRRVLVGAGIDRGHRGDAFVHRRSTSTA